MKKIGLISDTHAFLEPKIYERFAECDEIWHAGDIGNTDVADKLSAFKKLRAVYGNVDGNELRLMFPKIQIFNVEDVKVVMTHIGGYPGRYETGMTLLLANERPDIFISGHSHILKVMRDTKLNLLHINPGAAGNSGFHKIITMVRFQINGKDISNMEVYELDRRLAPADAF